MWGEKEAQKKETLFDGEHYTFLGKGVNFKGKAQFEGTVRVDGHFEGDIITDDTLIIGEHALIKGTITGGTIISGGRIEGDITASVKVQLLKPAVMIGNICAPSFLIEEGVVFTACQIWEWSRTRNRMSLVTTSKTSMISPPTETNEPRKCNDHKADCYPRHEWRVDSSVAASCLLNEGYRVRGVTLKTWEEEDETTPVSKRWQERGCCKVGMAKYVAKLLDISHEVIDIRETFTKEVMDDFVAGYLQGITPNPCVRCNERVKISALYAIAVQQGADYMATGHYAKIRHGTQPKLLQAKDARKDQSYFLYRLSSTWLSSLLFPLGDLEKSEVWKHAEVMGLPTDELKESQEICFVTQGDYRTFLMEHAPEASRPGPFLDLDGHTIGEHRGIAFYTPGQRKGLGLATGDRLYVQTVIPETHAVVLGPRQGLLKHECTVADLNVLDECQLRDGNPVDVKFRYASSSVPARLSWKDTHTIQVQFDSPQEALSPGQSAVFYRNSQVLGGGMIQRFP